MVAELAQYLGLEKKEENEKNFKEILYILSPYHRAVPNAKDIAESGAGVN